MSASEYLSKYGHEYHIAVLTVLQQAVRPQDLVVGDSHDLSSGLFEAHGLLEAVALDALVEMDDLDDGAVRGGQVVGLEG